ncbi:response regulator [bacterium]|nr:MAG: response regulator [bacterium]
MVYRPLNILLIEDNAEDESLALRALRGSDLALVVRIARDGEHALRALGLPGGGNAASAGVPDLIISDLKVPKLMGDEILQRARQDARLKSVPYVLFSSSDDRQEMQRCLRLGANAYEVKPIDFGEYVDRVRAIVQRWLGSREQVSIPRYLIQGVLGTA